MFNAKNLIKKYFVFFYVKEYLQEHEDVNIAREDVLKLIQTILYLAMGYVKIFEI